MGLAMHDAMANCHDLLQHCRGECLLEIVEDQVQGLLVVLHREVALLLAFVSPLGGESRAVGEAYLLNEPRCSCTEDFVLLCIEELEFERA